MQKAVKMSALDQNKKMNPDTIQSESETPPTYEQAATKLVNDQPPSIAPDQHSFNPLPAPTKRKRKKLYIVTILSIATVLIIVGVIWSIFGKQTGRHNHKVNTSGAVSASNSVKFFGATIPQVDCSQVKNLAKNSELLESSKDKYLCYKGGFTVDNEKMNYVAIQLTPEFLKEWQKKCTLDCGSSPSDYPAESVNEGTYIVRANNKVEIYTGFGGGGLEALLAEITGCGNSNTSIGISDKLKDGTLVVDNNKLGLLSKFSDLKVADGLGNVCTMDLEFVSYVTTNTDEWELTKSVSIKKASVHYEIVDISSCNNGQTPSTRISCYTAQAALRNDVTICENLASPQTANSITNGHDECVIAVAKRSRNPQTCDKIRYYREQFLAECQNYANDYKQVLKNDIIIN